MPRPSSGPVKSVAADSLYAHLGGGFPAADLSGWDERDHVQTTGLHRRLLANLRADHRADAGSRVVREVSASPPAGRQETSLHGRDYSDQRGALDALDDRYQRHSLVAQPQDAVLQPRCSRRKPVSDPVHRRRDDARGRRERVESQRGIAGGTKIEITNELAGRIESIIKREVPEMEHILVEVGGGGLCPARPRTPRNSPCS